MSKENLQDDPVSHSCCSEEKEECYSLLRQFGIQVCSCLLCLPCCDCVLHIRNKCVGLSCCSCCNKEASKEDDETATGIDNIDDEYQNEDNVSQGSDNGRQEEHQVTKQTPVWTVEDYSTNDNEGFIARNEEFLIGKSDEFSTATLEFPSRHNRTKSMPISKSLNDLKRSNFKNMTISSQRQLPRHALSTGRLLASASVQSLENVYIKGYKQTAV